MIMSMSEHSTEMRLMLTMAKEKNTVVRSAVGTSGCSIKGAMAWVINMN